MGQAQSLSNGEKLRGYYEAALAFIDPRLPIEASLEEIVASASQRQAQFARRPLDSVRADMQELAEALLFVQRTHAKVKAELVPAHTRTAYSQSEVTQSVPDLPKVKLLFESDHTSSPKAVTSSQSTVQSRSTNIRHHSVSRRSSAGDVVGSTALKPQQQLRPEPLELPLPAQVEPMRLSEDRAWPLAAGLLLMAWQAWLGCFSGWAVARLLAWPAPGYGLDMTWPSLTGVIALGAAVGIGVLLLARSYRVATHRIGLLVHLSGLAIITDTLAWWMAARRWPGLVDYPGWGVIAIIVVVWLAAWGAAAWHDSRVIAMRQALRAASKKHRPSPV